MIFKGNKKIDKNFSHVKLHENDIEKLIKPCISIYQKAKKKRLGKSERDYLKVVLLTKPPFDYLPDEIIDSTLDNFNNIDDLAVYIVTNYKDEKLWFFREKNLKYDEKNIKLRNSQFFNEFWGNKKE